VLSDWYVNPFDVLSVDGKRFEDVHLEWELGVAARRPRPFKISRITFDRVGIGLRFSEDTRGIRFFAGSIF
jgi:hypothetical protein